jgi:hypothetical protein
MFLEKRDKFTEKRRGREKVVSWSHYNNKKNSVLASTSSILQEKIYLGVFRPSSCQKKYITVDNFFFHVWFCVFEPIYEYFELKDWFSDMIMILIRCFKVKINWKIFFMKKKPNSIFQPPHIGKQMMRHQSQWNNSFFSSLNMLF